MTEIQTQPFVFFMLGALLQAVLLIRHRLSYFKIAALMVSLVGTFLLMALSSFFSLFGAVSLAIVWLLYFAATYAVLFKSDVLPVVTRRTLAGFTVIFWYLYLTAFSSVFGFGGWFFDLALIMSAGTLVITAFYWPLHKVWKVFCYAWFLAMVVVLALYHFDFPGLADVFYQTPQAMPLSSWEATIMGMALFYILIHLFYILELVPLAVLDPRKSTSFALWEWKRNTSLFSGKYFHNISAAPLDTIIVAIVFAVLLLANFRFMVLKDGLLVDLLILWAFNFSYKENAEPARRLG